MWLITTRGFYSVVADHYEDGHVLVRARVRGDLESLADLIPGLEVEETPARDHRFRASVPREAWESAVIALAEDIDYLNFKDAVAERQGAGRARVLLRCLGHAAGTPGRRARRMTGRTTLAGRCDEGVGASPGRSAQGHRHSVRLAPALPPAPEAASRPGPSEFSRCGASI